MEILPEVTFHLNELIVAIIFVVSAAITLIAKHKGLITFGKPLERRGCHKDVKKVCQEHVSLSKDVEELKKGQLVVKDLLSDVDTKVDKLIGYHLGKNGVNLG